MYLDDAPGIIHVKTDAAPQSILEDLKGSAWQALAFGKARRDTTNGPKIPWTLSSDVHEFCLWPPQSRVNGRYITYYSSRLTYTRHTDISITSLRRR